MGDMGKQRRNVDFPIEIIGNYEDPLENGESNQKHGDFPATCVKRLGQPKASHPPELGTFDHDGAVLPSPGNHGLF